MPETQKNDGEKKPSDATGGCSMCGVTFKNEGYRDICPDCFGIICSDRRKQTALEMIRQNSIHQYHWWKKFQGLDQRTLLIVLDFITERKKTYQRTGAGFKSYTGDVMYAVTKALEYLESNMFSYGFNNQVPLYLLEARDEVEGTPPDDEVRLIIVEDDDEPDTARKDGSKTNGTGRQAVKGRRITAKRRPGKTGGAGRSAVSKRF